MFSFSHALWSRHIMYTSLGTQRCPGFLKDFTEKLNFRYKNQAKNICVVLLSSPIQIWGKSVQGFRVMSGQTNRQTNRDYSFTYRYSPPLPSHPDTLYGIMLVKIRENCVNSNKTHLIPTLNIFLNWLFLGELTWNLRLTLSLMWSLMFYLFF